MLPASGNYVVPCFESETYPNLLNVYFKKSKTNRIPKDFCFYLFFPLLFLLKKLKRHQESALLINNYHDNYLSKKINICIISYPVIKLVCEIPF